MSEHYSEFGFYVCRKCLKPGDSVNLFSILDGPGRAKVFEDVTDILVRIDCSATNISFLMHTNISSTQKMKTTTFSSARTALMKCMEHSSFV